MWRGGWGDNERGWRLCGASVNQQVSSARHRPGAASRARSTSAWGSAVGEQDDGERADPLGDGQRVGERLACGSHRPAVSAGRRYDASKKPPVWRQVCGRSRARLGTRARRLCARPAGSRCRPAAAGRHDNERPEAPPDPGQPQPVLDREHSPHDRQDPRRDGQLTTDPGHRRHDVHEPHERPPS